MASIRNHYLLLVASNFTRLTTELDWVVKARRSTAAAYLARGRSEDKQDLFVTAKGVGKEASLTVADLAQLQEVWGRIIPGYGLFLQRFTRYNRRFARRNELENILNWKSSQRNVFSNAEMTWQLMDKRIMVHTHTHDRHSSCARTSYLCVIYTH
jgi:hypothetical protein